MISGIYCYKDMAKDNKIVYVGKDSHINARRRYYQHRAPSRYHEQPFNRVLQNNPDRYSYHVLKKGEFDKGLLNALEVIYVQRYNPKFNFTIGGDGVRGYKPTEETKQKLRDNHADFSGKNNPFYNKQHTEESKKKMSLAHKNKVVPENVRKKISETLKGRKFSEESLKKMSDAQRGKIITQEQRKKISKSKSSTNIFRVHKRKQKDCTQGFRWVYQYKEDGRHYSLSSVDLNKLKEKVLAKGLEWREF